MDWAHRNEPAEVCAAAAAAALAGGELTAAFQGGAVPIAPMIVLTWADRPEALEALDALQVVAHRSGSLFTANGLHMFRGHALYARGDLAAAEELLRTAEANSRMWGFGEAASQTFIRGILCSVLVERGDLAGARRALGPAWDRTEHEGVRTWLLARAAAARRRGRRRGCAGRRGRARRGLRPRHEPGGVALALAAGGGARAARPDREARALAEEELALARAWGAPGALGRALRVLGTLEGEAGLPRLEEAAAVLEGSLARLEQAKALAALGSALRRARRPAEARDPLRRSLELAAACAAPGLAEHVRTELYAAGARPRTDALAGVAALTASERRVADLAAAGETNRDIAQALYVTPKTVEVHLSNAYRKLGVRSRRELPEALGAA